MESKKTGSTNAPNSQFEVVIGHVTCRIFIAIVCDYGTNIAPNYAESPQF